EWFGPGGNFMIVGVPRESFPDERRVALVPLVVPNLTKAGFEVVIEAGAGSSAGYPDGEYAAKGAKIVTSRADVFRAADIVVQVLCYGSYDKTGKADVPPYRKGPVLIGFLRPLGSIETIREIASRRGTVSCVWLLARHTRAGRSFLPAPARASRKSRCGQRRGHHRRSHPGEKAAAAGNQGHGGEHGSGFRNRGPRQRARRELRADQSG